MASNYSWFDRLLRYSAVTTVIAFRTILGTACISIITALALVDASSGNDAIVAVAIVWLIIVISASFCLPERVWRSAAPFARMLILFGVIAAIANSTLAILMSVVGAPLESPWTVPWAVTYVPTFVSVVIVPAATIAIRVSGRSP